MNEVLFTQDVTVIDFICRILCGGCGMVVIAAGFIWVMTDTIKNIIRSASENERNRNGKEKNVGIREERKGKGKEDL